MNLESKFYRKTCLVTMQSSLNPEINKEFNIYLTLLFERSYKQI